MSIMFHPVARHSFLLYLAIFPHLCFLLFAAVHAYREVVPVFEYSQTDSSDAAETWIKRIRIAKLAHVGESKQQRDQSAQDRGFADIGRQSEVSFCVFTC